MYFYIILSVLLFAFQVSVAPPVTKEKAAENEDTVEDKELNLEYDRYLKEVVSILEEDEKFREVLETAHESHIKSGKIAENLNLVKSKYRTKLDEAKRTEIKRLIEIFERENGIQTDHLKIIKNHEHLDHENLYKFKEQDLKNLITKVTKDLEEADKKRREEFKEYEMHKKFEQEEKKKNMTEEEKTNYEKQLQENKIKQKQHEPLHHPGSKKQLEEVWQKQDNMDQEFNPKVFFHMHDVDGNHVWDENELKSVLLPELHKLYKGGHPEYDIVERDEDLERMKEHVLHEVDTNGDRLISYQEFLVLTQKAEFQQDPGWESIDQQQIYSNEEYQAYYQQQRKLAQEMYPPHPDQVHQPGFPQHQPLQPPQQGQHIGQGYQQIPPSQYGHQVPQQQYHPNDINYLPQYHHPNDVNYMPQQQQQQHNPNNINYMPQQPNYHPNQQVPGVQVPQQQHHHPQANVNYVPAQQFQQNPISNNNVPQQPSQQQEPVANANAVPQQQYQQIPERQQQQPQQTPSQQQQPQQQQNLPLQQQQQQPQQIPSQQQQPQPVPSQQQQPQQQQNLPLQQQQQPPQSIGINQFQQPSVIPNTNVHQQQQ